MFATLLDRWPTGLPRFAGAVIVLFGLGSLAFTVWNWQREVASVGASARNATVSRTEPVDPLPIILSGNLFGATAASASTSPVETARLATGYTLRAAFAGDSGGGGAIIEATGGEARWYAAGDTLADGAILREVHPDYVILERSGAPERLEFPKLTDLAVSAASATGTGATSAAEIGPSEPIPADASPEQKANIIRQRLEELRNRARK